MNPRITASIVVVVTCFAPRGAPEKSPAFEMQMVRSPAKARSGSSTTTFTCASPEAPELSLTVRRTR